MRLELTPLCGMVQAPVVRLKNSLPLVKVDGWNSAKHTTIAGVNQP